MEFKETADLLNAVGVKTTYTPDRLEEVRSPYENYYLLQREGEKWAYGLFIQERQNKPYLSVKETFETKKEGSRFFFLKRLSNYYFFKVIEPFKRAHKEMEFGKRTVEKLYRALNIAGIPKKLFYVDQKPNHRAIVLETKGNDYAIAFYGMNGKKVHATFSHPDFPLELDEALFFSFSEVFLLHLFETEVEALLQKENVDVRFTDEDVKNFILG
ncbi:hypothetical protein NSQ26_04570 [Bacillus sp. FSL W7-1360]